MTIQRFLIVIQLSVVSFSAQAFTPTLDLAVKVNPSQHTFEADAHIILNGQSLYTFELAPELIIDSADSAGRSINVKNIGNATQPRYEVILPKSTKHPTLHLLYHGQLSELNSAFNQSSPADRIPLFLSQEGSFLSANSHWYPDNGKLITYKITIQTPEDQIAVVPGTPVSEANSDHLRHATFIMDHPIEGIDLMIGAYEVKEKSFYIQQKQITLRTLSAFKARHHVASSTVGYGKSAMLFMALRAQLGNEYFYAALRTFWKKYQFKRAGFKELRQVFEQQSHTPLSRLFEQWLTKIGASDYAIEDAVYENGRLRFKLRDDAVFKIPVWARW